MLTTHIYTITVKGNVEREALSDGRVARQNGANTDVDVWAFSKEEAISKAEQYGKVLYCSLKE